MLHTAHGTLPVTAEPKAASAATFSLAAHSVYLGKPPPFQYSCTLVCPGRGDDGDTAVPGPHCSGADPNKSCLTLSQSFFLRSCTRFALPSKRLSVIGLHRVICVSDQTVRLDSRPAAFSTLPAPYTAPAAHICDLYHHLYLNP